MGTLNRSDMQRRSLILGGALGATGLLGQEQTSQAAEAGLETTRIRLAHRTTVCLAPQYIAEEFLRSEGFTDVQYVPGSSRSPLEPIADGRADITMNDAQSTLLLIDAGKPVVILAGMHGGCYQLFASERIRTIRDLRGKTVAIHYFGDGGHVLLAAMLSNVGINPSEVNWITGRDRNAMDVFADGKADAFMAFAQEPVELRMRKVGHVIADTSRDRPWNQYFCCMLVGNRDFVQRFPVATKRAVRSIMKAADLCGSQPERAARLLVELRHELRYPVGLEVMKSVDYNMWREANPEDTLRFHALRLREAGMVKSSPQQLIARGTDWRFLNELKQELKS